MLRPSFAIALLTTAAVAGCNASAPSAQTAAAIFVPTLAEISMPGGATQDPPALFRAFVQDGGAGQSDVSGQINAQTGDLQALSGVSASAIEQLVGTQSGAETLYQGGGANLTLRPHPDFRQSYSYTGQVKLLAGTGAEQSGIGGVQAPASSLPGTGDAVYNGEASVRTFATTDPADVDRLVGSAQIVANFGAGGGSVNVTIANLGHANGSSAAQAVDTIGLNGMTIENGRFSGSSAAQTEINGTVNGFPQILTGLNTTASARGAFFGPNPAGAPFETGGIFQITGDGGTIAGEFIGK